MLRRHVLILFLAIAACRAASAGEESGASELTFYGWSDQHVATSGAVDHLLPAIDAINALPGTEYPPAIGGRVAKPALVFGCGDITEWPTNAAKNAYAELLDNRLRFPSFDIVGNHDEGGKSPSETIKRWIVARHGALSYTFDRGGVRFVALYSKYDEALNNPAQAVSAEALDFLRARLAETRKDMPVIVALHLCFDAITNRDALADALAGANVILVLGGHYHKSKADRYRGLDFLQLPSPAPNGSREVMVVRIGSDRLVALPYNYEKKSWNLGPRVAIDRAIRGPKLPPGAAAASDAESSAPAAPVAR